MSLFVLHFFFPVSKSRYAIIMEMQSSEFAKSKICNLSIFEKNVHFVLLIMSVSMLFMRNDTPICSLHMRIKITEL